MDICIQQLPPRYAASHLLQGPIASSDVYSPSLIWQRVENPPPRPQVHPSIADLLRRLATADVRRPFATPRSRALPTPHTGPDRNRSTPASAISSCRDSSPREAASSRRRSPHDWA